MSDNKDNPFQESNLDSPEYRDRLMRKLNCLIAVLEVASAKVQKTLAGPSPDVERLNRIRGNLQNTLDVCQRAKKALERREALPKELQANLSQIAADPAAQNEVVEPRTNLPRGAAVEMSSEAEHKKFEQLERIDRSMIDDCDFEDLMRKLQA